MHHEFWSLDVKKRYWYFCYNCTFLKWQVGTLLSNHGIICDYKDHKKCFGFTNEWLVCKIGVQCSCLYMCKRWKKSSFHHNLYSYFNFVLLDFKYVSSFCKCLLGPCHVQVLLICHIWYLRYVLVWPQSQSSWHSLYCKKP
jgi:hypothetical protein